MKKRKGVWAVRLTETLEEGLTKTVAEALVMGLVMEAHVKTNMSMDDLEADLALLALRMDPGVLPFVCYLRLTLACWHQGACVYHLTGAVIYASLAARLTLRTVGVEPASSVGVITSDMAVFPVGMRGPLGVQLLVYTKLLLRHSPELSESGRSTIHELVNQTMGEYGLDKPDKFCNACGRRDGRLLRCGECKAVRYCSKQCQSQAWVWHKRTCQSLAECMPQADDLEGAAGGI
jgi:hypothetical protein